MQSGLTALSVTMVGAVTGLLPTAWPLVAGVILAFAAAGLAAWRHMPAPVLAYRGLCWLAAGAWSSGTLAWSTPWSRWPLVVLATGVTLGGMAGSVMAWLEQRPKPEKPSRFSPAVFLDDPLAEQWRDRIARVARVEVAIGDVDRWSGDPCPGFTLVGTMPLGGATWRVLQQTEEGLASDAGLPEGCSVKANHGGNKRGFRLDVMLRNALAEDKVYPRDYPVQSINEPRRIAYLPSDEPIRTLFRQEVAIIIGPTGTGKTNTMDVAIAEHLLCDDVIPCVIDFNAGALALPWLLPWRQTPDRCPNPPIPWVADTPGKALEMTAGILEVIKDRKQSYAHLKALQNTKLLPISASLPQWTIFLDEAAEVLGMDVIGRDRTVASVAENLREIQRIGRDAGARLVISSLAATNDTLGSRAVKVNANIKVAMGGTPIDELYYLFDTSKLSAEDAALPGSAHVKLSQGVPLVGKVPLLLPDQQAEIACATSQRRPEPDDRALAILGRRWTGRWDQSADLLAKLDAGVGAVEEAREMGRVTEPEPGDGASQAQEKTMDLEDLEESGRRLQRLMEAARAAREQDEAEAVAAQVEEPDWSVVDGWLDQERPEGDAPRPVPRVRVRQIVQEHRRDGIGPRDVWRKLREESYRTTEPTVIEWMRADLAAGILAQPGGERTPYVPGPKFTLDQP